MPEKVRSIMKRVFAWEGNMHGANGVALLLTQDLVLKGFLGHTY